LRGILEDRSDKPELQLGPVEKQELYDAIWSHYQEKFPGSCSGYFTEQGIKRPEIALIRCFDEIEEEDVEWLWHKRFPIGKSCELVGDPNVGKSFLCAEVIARLSTGEALHDDEVTERDPISCLFVSAEDAPEDTIKPRLRKAGADMSRVFFLDGFNFGGSENQTLNLKNKAHVRQLESEIKELKIGFLVLDPLDAFLGGTNPNINASVRELLTPLNKVLRDTKCTLLAIRHMNKADQMKAMYRAGASVGFTANARASFVVCEVPDTDERAVMCIKSNLAQMPEHIGYTIKPDEDEPDRAVLEWSSERPDVALGDLLRPDSTSSDTSDRADTEAWLIDQLSEGPVPSIELFEKAKRELSVSESTLKRAKKKMKGTEHEIESVRIGKEGEERGSGEWSWKFLRGSDPPDSTTDSETEPLKEIQLTKGISPSTASLTVQGDQSPESDPLKGLPF